MRAFGKRPRPMVPIPIILFLGLLLPVSQSVSHQVVSIDPAYSPLPSATIQSSTHVPDSTPVVVFSSANLVEMEQKERQKISYPQRSRHLQKRSVSAWVTEVTPYEERQDAAIGTPLRKMGGLEYWTFFSELIRRPLQGVFGDFSMFANVDFDISFLMKFGLGQGLPLAGFAGFLVIVIVITLLASPFAWCCLFGGCCMRGKVAYEPRKRISTAVCIVLFSALLIIGAITNISGSSQLSLGIRATWGTFNGLLEDVLSLVSKLDPTVQEILELAETTVNGSITTFATIDVPLLKTMVGGQVLAMAGNLKAIKTDLGYVKNNGTTLQSTIDDLKEEISILETRLNKALDDVNELNNHQTSPEGQGYELFQDIAGIPSAETIDVSGLPNITQLLEPIDSVPDLDITATNLTSQFDGLEDLVDTFITAQTTAIKDQIKVQIDTAGATASEMITQQVPRISSQIAGAKKEAVVIVTYIDEYEFYRQMSLIGVSGGVFAMILAVGGGIVTRSKRIVCCCGVAVVPLMTSTAIFGLAYFALALPIGTLCNLCDTGFADFAMYPDMVTTVQKSFNIIDDCYTGSITLIDIGKEFGMDMNVTAIIAGQLGSFDIQSVASGIDLSSAVQLDQYDIGATTSSYLDFSVNLTAFNEVSTGDLPNAMGKLTVALQDLDSELTSDMFLYDSPPVPSQEEKDAVIPHFRSLIAAALDSIGKVNETESTVSETIATIKSDAAEMVVHIDHAKGQGADAGASFAEFSAGVDTFLNATQKNFTTWKSDQVRSDLDGLVRKVDNTLTELAQCVVISSDVKAWLNTMCISMLGGADALWFSLVFMSVFLICMSITTCCAACRLANPDAYEGDGADEFGDQSKQRYKPKKKETITKSFSMDGIKKSSAMAPSEGISTSREEIDRMLRKQDEETAERKKKLEEENEAVDEKVTLRRDGSKASTIDSNNISTLDGSKGGTIRREPSLGESQPAAPFRSSMTSRRRSSQVSVLNRPPSFIQTPPVGSPGGSKIDRSDYFALPTGPQIVSKTPVYSPSGTMKSAKVSTPRASSLAAAPSKSEQARATLDDLEAEMARLAQDTGSRGAAADTSYRSGTSTGQPARLRTSTFGTTDGVPTTIFEANSVPILSVNDPAQLDRINAQLEGLQYESTKGNQKEPTASYFDDTDGSKLSIAVPPYSPSDMSPLSASEHAESPLLSQPPLPSFPPPAAPEKSHYDQ